MIEYLDAIDKSLLIYLNSLHCNFFDVFMWYVSKTATWMPMTLVLLFIVFRKNSKQSLLVIFGITLTILLADQISSGLIKGLVERFRPTHNPNIENLIHVVNGYRGGLYGFVSSHAANTLGVAIFISLLFRNKILCATLIFWSTLVAYSRIYLGVHYPGDILGGMCVGFFSGLIAYKIYNLSSLKLFSVDTNNSFNVEISKESHYMTYGILCNLLVTLIVSFLCVF